MKNCVILILIYGSIVSCIKEKYSVDFKKIEENINTIPDLHLDTIFIYSNNLYINHTDSFNLVQPYFYDELLFLVFRNNFDLKSIEKFDSIYLSFVLPSINDSYEVNKVISSKNLIDECEKRFKENSLYEKIIQIMFNNLMITNKRISLVLISDRYGFIVSNKSKDKIIYNENLYSLLLDYSMECNSDSNKIATSMMWKVQSELEKIENHNAKKVSIVWEELINLCER